MSKHTPGPLNAHLITYAPELLKACRHAHVYLVQSNDPEKRELADELWAAIIKAEGRDAKTLKG